MLFGASDSTLKDRLSIVFAASWIAILPQATRAGSISGDDDSGLSSTCDKPVAVAPNSMNSWCTQSLAVSVSTGCYATISPSPIVGRKCSWQGCGHLSLIGKPATTDGVHFVEYGMKTPRNGAGFLNLSTPAGGVLPQWPFARHYLTAGDALKAKRACPANPQNLPSQVLDVICNKADASVINLNPYWWCMSSKL